MGELTPTADELRAINALKRVAKQWPASLRLFSASGTLCVMRLADDGSFHARAGGVDPAFVLDTINIPNDGGDW